MRVFAGVLSTVLAPLLISACDDSTAPAPAIELVWSTVPSPTIRPLTGVWGTSESDVWAVGDVGSNGGVDHTLRRNELV